MLPVGLSVSKCFSYFDSVQRKETPLATKRQRVRYSAQGRSMRRVVTTFRVSNKKHFLVNLVPIQFESVEVLRKIKFKLKLKIIYCYLIMLHIFLIVTFLSFSLIPFFLSLSVELFRTSYHFLLSWLILAGSYPVW